MIRRRIIYLSGILFALFISSCSHEDLIENTEETGLRGNERTITITQPDNTKYQGATTKATASAVVATCIADAGRILIFEASSATGPFVYKERPIAEEAIAFTKQASSEWWEGKSSYTPEAGKYYMVYAYAYDSKSFSENLQTELSVSGKTLRFNTGEILTADKMASFTMPPVAGVPSGSTQEVFGEYLRSVVDGKPVTGVINGSEKRSLSGELLRETGRLQISLTEIAEFTKASMVMEYCNTIIPVRASHSEGIGTTPFEKKRMVTVAVSDITEGKVSLSADLFRIDETYVYVELEKEGGEKVRYPVRCGNLEVTPTIADAVEETIVKDYKITVPTNFWLTLSGSYDQLNKSNLTIKTAWGKDYEFDGGYLIK